MESLDPMVCDASIEKSRLRAGSRTLVFILLLSAAFGAYHLSSVLDDRGVAAVYLSSDTKTVHLFIDRAEPEIVWTKAGDEIVFVAKEGRHNMAEERKRKNDARLESGEFGVGESYSLVFQGTGEFSFYDRLNQDIRVDIVIE